MMQAIVCTWVNLLPIPIIKTNRERFRRFVKLLNQSKPLVDETLGLIRFGELDSIPNGKGRFSPVKPQEEAEKGLQWIFILAHLEDVSLRYRIRMNVK